MSRRQFLGTIVQQPRERLDYDINFSANDLGDPGFLTDQDYLVEPPEGPDPVITVTPAVGLTVSAHVIDDGKRVKLWIEDGVSGETYHVEGVVTTAIGARRKEFDLIVKIKATGSN